jgi:hypothetical protein
MTTIDLTRRDRAHSPATPGAKRAARAPMTTAATIDPSTPALESNHRAPRTPVDGDRFDSPQRAKGKENVDTTNAGVVADAPATPTSGATPLRVRDIFKMQFWREFPARFSTPTPRRVNRKRAREEAEETTKEEIRTLRESLREERARCEASARELARAKTEATKSVALASAERVTLQMRVSELGRELAASEVKSRHDAIELREMLRKAESDARTLGEKLRDAEKRAKAARGGAPRTPNAIVAREYIASYFASRRCDSAGLDELMAHAPRGLNLVDLLSELAERVVDSPGCSASHMVVVHQI